MNRRAILANFQFAKMAMVEDLKRNADTIAASAIVAAVAGHPASRRHLAQAVADLEPAALDELPASDDYLVLDADSTQHRAIVQAGAGQNGVMQGPPGTARADDRQPHGTERGRGPPSALRGREASRARGGDQAIEP